MAAETDKQRQQRGKVLNQLRVMRDKLFHFGMDDDAFALSDAITAIERRAQQRVKAEERERMRIPHRFPIGGPGID